MSDTVVVVVVIVINVTDFVVDSLSIQVILYCCYFPCIVVMQIVVIVYCCYYPCFIT